MNREKIENLARERANSIIEYWWRKCIWEFQEEKQLTDKELKEVLKVDVKAYTTSDIEEFIRRGA